jgi:hypothetical protein
MTKEVDEMSAASRGSQPFAWAADIPGKFGAAPTVLFGHTEKLVWSIAAAGGDAVRPFPLYRSPALTDEEQLAIAWAAREADEWDEEDTPEVAAHAEVLRGLAKRLF